MSASTAIAASLYVLDLLAMIKCSEFLGRLSFDGDEVVSDEGRRCCADILQHFEVHRLRYPMQFLWFVVNKPVMKVLLR